MTKRLAEILVRVPGPERDLQRIVDLCESKDLRTQRIGNSQEVLVEVPVSNTAKRAARGTAVSHLLELVGEQVPMQVIESSLIAPRVVPLVYIHAHKPAPNGWRGKFYKAASLFGVGALNLVVGMPHSGDKESRIENARSGLGRSPISRDVDFSLQDLYLRQEVGSASAAAPASRGRRAVATIELLVVALLVSGAGLTVRFNWDDWSRWVLILGATMSLIVAYYLTGSLVFDREERKLLATRLLRVLLVLIFFVHGLYLASAENSSPKTWLRVVLGALIILPLWFGLSKFARIPWARKNAWAALGTVGASAGLLSWVSTLLWTYFFESFDVPGSVARRDAFMDISLPAKPLGALSFIVILAVVVIGYAYYFGFFAGPNSASAVLALLIIPVYVLGVAVSAFVQVEKDVESVRAAANSDKAPPTVHMLQLERVCLSVVSKSGIVGDPTPPGSPVIMFPTTDGRIWVWEPPKPVVKSSPHNVSSEGDGRTISMPADAVNVRILPDGQKTCS